GLPRAGEVNRVRDELVEQLRGEVGRSHHRRLFLREREIEGLVRIGEPVAFDAACDYRGEIEALALERIQSLLQARRPAHAREDRAEALQAFLRALDVDA